MQMDINNFLDDLRGALVQVQALVDVVSMSQSLHGLPEAQVLEVARERAELALGMLSKAEKCPLLNHQAHTETHSKIPI